MCRSIITTNLDSWLLAVITWSHQGGSLAWGELLISKAGPPPQRSLGEEEEEEGGSGGGRWVGGGGLCVRSSQAVGVTHHADGINTPIKVRGINTLGYLWNC